MEADRIIGALNAAQQELTEGNLTERLATLAETASTAAQSPSDADATTAFSTELRQLREELGKALSQYWGPSTRKAMQKLGLSDLLAPTILRRITEIVDAQPFMLGQAAQELTELSELVTEKSAALDKALVTLKSVHGISGAGKFPDYELGVMLPSNLVANDLKKVTEQLGQWVKVFDVITEVNHGRPMPTIELSGASTGTFQFFVSLDPQDAMTFLVVVGGIVKIFKSVAERKELKARIASIYTRDVVLNLEQHEKTFLDDAKKEILDEVMKEVKGERASELRTHLRTKIDFLLRSMNNGVDVEVNANKGLKEAEGNVEQKLRQLQQRISQLALDLNKEVAKLPSRDKPLLELPSPTSDESDATAELAGKDPEVAKPNLKKPQRKKGSITN